MSKFPVSFWIKSLLINLLIVVCMGVLMRYKIGFEFPYFEQRNILHAHSHFAFSGWITQALLVFITQLYEPFLTEKQRRKLCVLLWLNNILSYCMLISFFIQGYGMFSIAFSSASILLIFAFALLFYKNSDSFPESLQSLKWINAGLLFAIISSIGTAVLAYTMTHKITNQFVYLSSVYFYLHFQYNGWFFFACMGLFVAFANKMNIEIKKEKTIFILFFSACLPAYFLSTLWANIPNWLYVLVLLAAISQMYAWILLLKNMWGKLKNNQLPKIVYFLICYLAIALSIKFMLQLGSTVPSISKLAFGFRPIVIAYLHLVLLAIISILIILYMLVSKYIINRKWAEFFIYCFATGVFLNELSLAVQGISSLFYISIPYINNMLFGISIILFVSVLSLLITQIKKEKYRLLS